MTRTLRRGAAALTLAFIGLTAAPATAAPADGETPPRIETVIDLSGSMNETDAGGQSRLAAAKTAVGRLLDGTPDGTAMGLRVYGSSYAGEAMGPGCKDTRLLAPVGPMGIAAKTSAKARVQALKAVGMTPIGRSLQAAAADLGNTGPRRIILVSDGEDTCAPPSPCQVARELQGAGVDLVVDTVGLKVGAATKRELTCIAKATKGTYVDAGDADELADRLDQSVKRALTPYAQSGTKTRGGKDCPSAPVLTPGQYLDRFGYGQSRWYKVRLHPGQAVRFSGSVIPAAEWDTPTSVRTQISLPGQPGIWETETAVEDRWSNVMSSGVQSDRLKWDEIPAGAASTDVCAEILNSVKTSQAEPVEVAVGITGQAVKSDGSRDTRVNAPSAEDGQPTTAQTADSDRGVATEETTAAASLLDRPVTLGLSALATFGLILVIRSAVTRNRRRGA
ncbi:von Willebrand factor type A domain protein [Streptomyces sp. ADI92-24]|uniref:VWA domain-containing protein n=1 Tax=Streptomyces sp. ADI92-24 TaxID=1522756 RepID=UPI000F554F35|nr:VWA domain-containing protein [Streptomyces sp. ADI92-24]RPK32441.1 von Willebrand factor type A domain protein [Streptomyces sp. ADI92-24]